MAILSVLWRGNLWKTVTGFQKTVNQLPSKAPFRNMASDHHHHPKVFHVTPSRFNYTQFKDDFHFYAMLGIIPLGTIIFLVNIYVGPAELAETPEGYEPKHWEYYQNPIKRFFARYFQPPEEQEYEKHLHLLQEEMDRVEWRVNWKKVRKLMAERGDYKGPFFIPTDIGRQVRRARYEAEQLEESKGF